MTTTWARLYVRFARLFFWTLAARRQEWREHCRWCERADARPTGVAKVVITATNGSVVKNVYVNHGELPLLPYLALEEYRRHGHSRMPRA